MACVSCCLPCLRLCRTHPAVCLPAEYRAIRNVLGHDSLRMNSTKSMIGHLLGGAGAVEAVATIKAIETGGLLGPLNLCSRVWGWGLGAGGVWSWNPTIKVVETGGLET